MAVTERVANAHIGTLKEDLKTRLLLHYETVWDSPEMNKHRAALSHDFLSLKDHPSWPDIFYDVAEDAVPNFFESVGMHLRHGHFEPEMVLNIFGYYVPRYALMLGDLVARDRREHPDEDLWSEFLYLFEEFRKFETQRLGRPYPAPPTQEIVRFAKEEAGDV
jgi:hypothetical protein